MKALYGFHRELTACLLCVVVARQSASPLHEVPLVSQLLELCCTGEEARVPARASESRLEVHVALFGQPPAIVDKRGVHSMAVGF